MTTFCCCCVNEAHENHRKAWSLRPWTHNNAIICSVWLRLSSGSSEETTTHLEKLIYCSEQNRRRDMLEERWSDWKTEEKMSRSSERWERWRDRNDYVTCCESGRENERIKASRLLLKQYKLSISRELMKREKTAPHPSLKDSVA